MSFAPPTSVSLGNPRGWSWGILLNALGAACGPNHNSSLMAGLGRSSIVLGPEDQCSGRRFGVIF